jgi:tRNA threonylcarbamoyladenosine biosynthesis protein TsaB
MATILNIETATAVCSVVLAKDGKVLAFEEANEGMAHAEKVAVFIQDIMKRAALPLSSLDAIAIGSGPGSYTGLRIGTATAKGLCYTLGKPLISVPTLQAMAMAAAKKLNRTDALYCPMIDARRLEVYTALYDSTGKEVLPVHAKILDESSFSEYKAIAFFGDGMPKMKNMFPSDSSKIWMDDIVASALNMCSIAEAMYQANTFSDVAYYEPFYLKDFVAGKKKTGL